MDREKLVRLIFEKAKANGIEDIEVYINDDSSTNFNIYEGSVEKYIVQEEENFSVRGIYKGKMGYSYTEKIDLYSLDELINNLIQYAKSNFSHEKENISNGIYVAKIPESEQNENLLYNFTEEEKVEYMLDLEKKAYRHDKRVKKISNCSYAEKLKKVYIKNTKGLELEDSHIIGIINLAVVTEELGNMQTGYSHYVFSELKEDYKDKLIVDSVEDGIAMLGAEPAKSSNYEIILRNNVMADMLSSFSSIFLGSQVQRNLSLLKGKLGSKVAVNSLSIAEYPLMYNGYFSRVFDDEGTETSNKYIIESGILKTFLHNNKTAQKDNIKSTGNGFRNSHKSSVEVIITNMYIEKRDNTLDDMIKIMRNGIIITDIDGLHAGINPISGNFSLLSKGLLVEEGKITKAVSKITIAGNFYEMLKNIKYIGNDIKFSNPGTSYFGSPSIYVGSLAVAGK